jgi:hypothetical protein
MANTTLSLSNSDKPAPRWYRISKRIIYLLAGSSIASGTLSRFGLADADINLVLGWLIMIGEALSLCLANGQVYAEK